MDQQIKNPPPMQETQEMRVQSMGREDVLERGMAIAPVFLHEQSHGQRRLAGYSPEICGKAFKVK